MGFASAWLNEKALFPEFIKEAPDNQTGIIVIVPAFDEPGLAPLLNSLISCDEPGCKVEVIVVVNAPADSSAESLENNSRCIENIIQWKNDNKNRFFEIHVIDTGRASVAGWGVGLARKTGMDEALRRFNTLEKPEGVILCLDADCTVEVNYFTSLCDELLQKKENKACSVYFEHPLSGSEFPDRIYSYIALYELHLRYFVQGLKYSGFPYAFHTVGSALAVKALQYVKAGGMNRRQAGEDFYFIQKLAPLGGYFALNTTTVFPSPRESYRVPFGTGAMVAKLMDDIGDRLLTYNTEAFNDLKILFNVTRKLYDSDQDKVKRSYKILPPGLRSFMEEAEWTAKINEILRNISNNVSFMKRFFVWFNMFRIVKYMNHVHQKTYSKVPVQDSAYDMLVISGLNDIPKDTYKLLMYYRSLEKGSQTAV
jgi:hypothetical protein